MLEDRLSEVFPDLFSMTRPIVTPDVPVIVSATMLTAYDAPMLPLTKVGPPINVEKRGVKLFQAVGSFPIISLLIETEPRDYYKVLWNSSATTNVLIGTVEFDDSLKDLLEVFSSTGFGDARVDGAGPPPALITLNEVISLYKHGRLRCSLAVKDVASQAIDVDPDARLMDAMKVMKERRVRRVFLKGRKGEFISDRNILATLFSPKGLKIARDSPESWTDLDLSAVGTSTAHLVSPTAMVEDVAKLVEQHREVFMPTTGETVVSRWDLVMKPWKSGHLRTTA